MRVFIGLTEIAGYYRNLKAGFEQLGIKTTLVDLEDHPYRYGSTEGAPCMVRLATFASRQRKHTPRAKLPQKFLWVAIAEMTRFLLFVWAMATHDVFIFGFNTSFFFFYDFPILKKFNKQIICSFLGSDARPPYIDGAVMGNGFTIEQCIQLAMKKKKALKKVDRYANHIISHPYHGQFHEKPFLHTTLIGFPYAQSQVSPTSDEHQVVRILHSPSHPQSKGTSQIRQAITSLKAKGLPIDYVEITGKPNREVLAEIARCDFVVDQLYSDLLLAGFATEAAFFGKPAVVGGYGLEAAKRCYPNGNPPPSHICHPDEIEAAIEKLVVDRSYRLQLGKAAQEFVQTQWTPAKVAGRYLDLIRGDIPDDWLCLPHNINYLYGYGLPEEKVKNLVGDVIRQGGVAGLQISDKPELERRFAAFGSAHD